MISLSASLKRRFATELERVKEQHRGGMNGLRVVAELTDVVDDILKELYTLKLREMAEEDASVPESSALCLAAVGGYGRAQLNPYSDVDIAFLHTGRISKPEADFVKRILHVLWDSGFDLGHSCRSIDECIARANEDSTVKTALSESRFLIGNRQTYHQFREDFRRRALARKQSAFVTEKIKERAERYKRHGSTFSVQEPHLKEGAGGVRDFHHGLWLATVCYNRRTLEEMAGAGIISRRQAERVRDALGDLFRLRNELHFLTREKNDLLSMEFQTQAATNLGYRDEGDVLNYQPMMDSYYRAAREIQHFAEAIERRCQGQERGMWSWFEIPNLTGRASRKDLDPQFFVENDEVGVAASEEHNPFRDHPELYLRIFEAMLDHNAHLHPDTKQLMTDGVDTVRESLQGDAVAAGMFLSILTRREPIGRALRAMNETGFLGAFLPPFAVIRHMVRHDLYHRYTVDEHTLRVLEAGDDLIFGENTVFHAGKNFFKGSRHALARQQTLNDIASRTKRLDLFRWVLLCHDIGKGHGSDHDVRGAEITDAMLKDLGYSDEDRAWVRFLIVQHRTLSHTAFHRDIDDPRTIMQFTEIFSSKDELGALLLLTIADLAGVADNMLTEWKWNLLWQLFLRSIRAMDGLLDEPEDVAHEEAIGGLVEALQDEFEPAFIRQHLEQLPPEYAFAIDEDRARRHLHAVKDYDPPHPTVRATWDPATQYIEVDIIAKDRIGLFHDIARAFPPENFNIETVRLYTRNDGITCDTLSALGQSLSEDQVDQRLELLCERIVRNIERPRPIDLTSVEPLPPPAGAILETRVDIFNHISKTATVIDVQSVDRPGLLSVVAGVLSGLGLDIRFARLHTQGGRVLDAFYVTEKDGAKVSDKNRMELIRQALLLHI